MTMGLRLRHQLFLNRTIGATVALAVILLLAIRFVETQDADLRIKQTTTELQRIQSKLEPDAPIDWSDTVDTMRYTWSIEEANQFSSSAITVNGDTGIGHMPVAQSDGVRRSILVLKPIDGMLPPPTPLRPWILSAFFTLIAVAGLGWFMDRRMARPYERIAIALQRIAAGDHEIDLDDAQSGVEQVAIRRSIQSISAELFKRIRKGARGKRHMETILENMSEGVLAIKSDHSLMLANGRARKMLSMPAPLAPGIDETIDAIPIPDILRDLQQCVVDGLEQQTECTLEQTNGTVYLELNTQPLRDIDHTVLGAICVFRDVSIRNANEQMRRDFVANVSHELKTPLTAITGAAETILQDRGITLDEARPFVAKIDRHTRRLGGLINDVLELSKLQSDNPKLESEPLSIAALASDIVDVLNDEADSRQVTLTCMLPDEATTFVGDLRALSLAIENIIVNAIRYTNSGGSVAVKVTRHTGEVRVAITDTGCGIAPEDTERIFERFYRVDTARSRETGGTGLGLAIAKNAIAAHEGLIRIESKLGQGTTFTIILPTDN